MITSCDFLHGTTVAYVDMAGRKIMAECHPVGVCSFRLRLFDFHTLGLLKTYNMSEKTAVIFFNNHCNGLEKNVVLPFPASPGSNSDKSNQPQ